MRCVACNEMLSDDEAIARYSDTGGHVNLCSYCKQMSKENILECADDDNDFIDFTFSNGLDINKEQW